MPSRPSQRGNQKNVTAGRKDRHELWVRPHMEVATKAKLSSKGELTLPAAVCKALGVAAGDIVVFELREDGFRIVRDRDAQAFEKWLGRLRKGRGRTADAIDRKILIARGHDDE